MDQYSCLFRVRAKVWITLDNPGSSWYGQAISAFVMTIITASILNFSIGSYSQDFCQWENAQTSDAVRTCGKAKVEDYAASKSIELVCIMIFTAEYILRLLTCRTAENMTYLKFLFDPLNLIDLVAVLPWYIIQILTISFGADDKLQKIFGVVRVIRLTRILRVFKVSKSMKMFLVLVRTVQRSTTVLLLLLVVVSFMMVLFGAFAVAWERGYYNPHTRQYLRFDGAPSPFLGIPEAMYWCMATMTTVGYGDLYPVTTWGQIIGCAAMLAGTIILSLPITVIGATFSEEYQEQQRISARQRRLARHNTRMGLAPKKRGLLAVLRRGRRMRDKDGSVVQSAPANAPKTYFTAGLVECEWLLEEYRDTIFNDVKALMTKGEADLMRMSRTVIIHSRVLSVNDAGERISLVNSRSSGGQPISQQEIDDELDELDNDELTAMSRQHRNDTIEADIPNRRVRRP